MTKRTQRLLKEAKERTEFPKELRINEHYRIIRNKNKSIHRYIKDAVSVWKELGIENTNDIIIMPREVAEERITAIKHLTSLVEIYSGSIG